MARASILWLLGEYCERVPKVAPDVLRKMAKTFGSEVRFNVLTAPPEVWWLSWVYRQDGVKHCTDLLHTGNNCKISNLWIGKDTCSLLITINYEEDVMIREWLMCEPASHSHKLRTSFCKSPYFCFYFSIFCILPKFKYTLTDKQPCWGKGSSLITCILCNLCASGKLLGGPLLGVIKYIL